MQTIRSLWDFLNNKKTVVGALLLLIAQFLQQIQAILPDQAWIAPVADGLVYLGNFFAGTGLTHKFAKLVKEAS